MIDDSVVQHIRERAGLPSEDHAVRAMRATLQTLAERIPADSSLRLQSLLPPTAAVMLVPGDEMRVSAFSFDEFCQRLADREGTDVPVAVFHARTVLQELGQDPVVAAELTAVASQLSNDFAPLFWQPAGAATAA